MNWIALSMLLLCAPCVLAMDKRVEKNPHRSHYDFHKKTQYFYRQRKVVQDSKAAEEKGGSNANKPLASLIHDKSNHLIIATTALSSSEFQEIVVTVKKRTDVDWTNVYCVEHKITKNSDYFIGFMLEAYLKEKIKAFESAL